MANLQVSWNGSTADWSTSADWSSGVVPNDSGTDATLAGTGGYTVTISTAESFTVGSLAITDRSAALQIAGGHLMATGMTSVAGDFELQFGASATLSGALTVTGSLNIDSTTAGTTTGSNLTVGGDLTNSGTIDIGTGGGGPYGDMGGGGIVSVSGTLANSGLLNIFDSSATATVVTAAALVDTGTINLNGDARGDGTGAAELIVTGSGTAGSSVGLNTGTISSNRNGVAVGGGLLVSQLLFPYTAPIVGLDFELVKPRGWWRGAAAKSGKPNVDRDGPETGRCRAVKGGCVTTVLPRAQRTNLSDNNTPKWL